MEFLSEKEDEWGPPTALYEFEIKNMFKLANLSKNDIFFDLGSGDGEIVRMALKKRHVKEANGIEADIKRFLNSIEYTRDEFTKPKLQKIELWRAFYQDYDFSCATVVYNGLYSYGEDDELETYNKLFAKTKKPVKIIKRDLPLFPYKPIKSHRDKKGSWFFLMKTPLQKYRLRNKDKWAQYVLGKSDAIMNDVYEYYLQKLNQRFKDEGSSKKEAVKEAKECLLEFKKLVKQRFPQI